MGATEGTSEHVTADYLALRHSVYTSVANCLLAKNHGDISYFIQYGYRHLFCLIG